MEQEQAKMESDQGQARAQVSTRARVLVLALELAKDRGFSLGEALSAIRLAAEAESAFELARVRVPEFDLVWEAERAVMKAEDSERWEEGTAAVRAAGLDREFL